MRLQSAYDNAAAKIAHMNQPLGASIWSDSASGNENARPTQPTGATPSAPKSFSFDTSTASSNNIDTASSTPPAGALPPHVQASRRAPSPALSASSTTSTPTDATIADMSNTARGPTLFNPQQAKLLKSDPDYLDTRRTSARPSRSRATAVASSPAPSSAPRQSLMASFNATPSRAPMSNGPSQWNQMQKEEPRGRATQITSAAAAAAVAANPHDRINEHKAAAPAPATPLSQATARGLGSMGGEEKVLKVESTVNSTNSSTAATPAVSLREPTSSSSNSGDKLLDAVKARFRAIGEDQEAAKKAKAETPAAPPAAPLPSTSSPAPAPAPVFSTPLAISTAKPAAAEPSAADRKTDLMNKAAAVEKKAELDVPSLAAKPIAPHERKKAAEEKPTEPPKAAPKVERKIQPKVEAKAEIKPVIKTEPKIEPAAAAPKPTNTPKPPAMPTPAASPDFDADAAYQKRVGELVAITKQNPARAAMEWDSLNEMNTVLEEMAEVQQERGALVAKRIEMNAKIDAAIALKDMRIAGCLNTYSRIKKMRKEEEEEAFAQEGGAKLNGLKQEE